MEDQVILFLAELPVMQVEIRLQGQNLLHVIQREIPLSLARYDLSQMAEGRSLPSAVQDVQALIEMADEGGQQLEAIRQLQVIHKFRDVASTFFLLGRIDMCKLRLDLSLIRAFIFLLVLLSITELPLLPRHVSLLILVGRHIIFLL